MAIKHDCMKTVEGMPSGVPSFFIVSLRKVFALRLFYAALSNGCNYLLLQNFSAVVKRGVLACKRPLFAMCFVAFCNAKGHVLQIG